MKLKMTKEELVANYEKHNEKIANRESKRLIKLYKNFVFWVWVHIHLAAFKGRRRLTIRLMPKYIEVFKSAPFGKQFRDKLRNELSTYEVEFSCESEYKSFDYTDERIVITWGGKINE